MVHKIWHKLVSTVTGGAVLIAFFSILSKLAGLLRDRLLASQFGADAILDIYYASFRLPDLIFNTLVLGALSAAFIPVFVRLWSQNKDAAYELANIILTKLTGALVVLAGVGIVAAPWIVRLIAPGFDDASQQTTIVLTRIMLLSIIFFGISNVLSGILNSVRDFVPYAIAPIFYNIGIIVGLFWFYPMWGVQGLAYGVVLGSILHLLIQWPSVNKHGWRWKWLWRSTTEVNKIVRLMIPRTIGLAANQVNQVVITSIASTLTVGSIAIFNLANNLQHFPVSIFGLSLAIAAFPAFSQAWSTQNMDAFRGSFTLTFRKILFLIIPVAILILVLRAQIVRLVLGAGSFDWQDTYYTAQVLGIFAISLFAQGTIPLLARSFYAFEDTKTPVIIGVGAVVVNLILSFWLAPIWGVIGLAAAFSFANILNMLALLIVLREKIGDIDDKQLIRGIVHICLSSLAAGLTAYALLHVLAAIVDMQTFMGIAIQAVVAFVGGIGAYLMVAYVLGLPEIKIASNFYRQIFKKPVVNTVNDK
ncbi:MAG: murein biosynthesis integral membrane protein MurJ [Candidatus Komeilibacteria bacterium]|nr:murein biosynthesis integral membrane protein MurJ [Candidatus Komeilibacteria bacterium]